MTSPIQSFGIGDMQSPDKNPEKLKKAAQDFESLLISQIFKSVRESEKESALSGEKDETSDIALGMAEEHFARAMASQGGMGLARMVMHSQELRSSAIPADQALQERPDTGADANSITSSSAPQS